MTRVVGFLALALVALSILGWVVGAIISAVKFVLVVGLAVGIIWAIASSKAERD